MLIASEPIFVFSSVVKVTRSAMPFLQQKIGNPVLLFDQIFETTLKKPGRTLQLRVPYSTKAEVFDPLLYWSRAVSVFEATLLQ